MTIVKKALIVGGILVAGLLLIAGYFIFTFKSETNKMTPVETGNIVENIYAIKDGFANMFLIQDGDQYLAIDAGMDKKVISAELKKLNIDPANVVAVLLTHTDMDHVGGLPLFKNAKVYLAREEVKMLNGEAQKIPGVNNKISREDYVLLDDKQTFSIGKEEAFAILTAGHTTGSICFQINGKYLFTGDILSLHVGKIGKSVKFFDLNHDMTTKSISRIVNLPNVEYIFTSHWGITADYKNAVKDWK